MKNALLAAVAAIGLLAALPATARAQDYPTKTIQLIVPFPPGGGTDLTARIVAQALTQSLGQTVVVENKAGAASQIGIEQVAKAPHDGYTLLWASSDGVTILPAVKPTVPYKVPGSFTFISAFASYPLILAINAKLPVHSLADLAAYAKTHAVHYSSSGAGGGGHLEAAYVAQTLGVPMTHVPYDGAAPAVTAVVGGFADFVMPAPSSIIAQVNSGSIRALATTGSTRSSLLPDVPTMKELGYPQLSVDLFYGMMAPAGTPEAIVTKLRDGVAAVLKDPATKQKLQSLGLAPFGIAGTQFRDFVAQDLQRWTVIAHTVHVVIGAN